MPSDPVPVARDPDRSPGPHDKLLPAPAKGGGGKGSPRCGVTRVQLVEEAVPEDDAPTLGDAGRVPLEDRDLVPTVLLLHQDREVEPGWASADGHDSHAWKFPAGPTVSRRPT